MTKPPRISKAAKKIHKMKFRHLFWWTVDGLIALVWYGGKGAYKVTRWTAPKLGRVAYAGGRAAWTFSQPRVIKAAHWTAKHTRAATHAGATKAAAALERKVPKAAAAAGWIADHTRPARTRGHAAPIWDTGNQAPRSTPPARPAPQPAPPVKANATAHPGAPANTTAAPAAGHTAHGGRYMQQEYSNLVRASQPVGALDPKTALELDAQLAALAHIWPAIADNLNRYAENLDRVVKIDPRVVSALMSANADVAGLARAFVQARQRFHVLYGPMLQAAQTATRMPDRKGFWDQKQAA